MTNNTLLKTKPTSWEKVKPGVYTRKIRRKDRIVDREFIEELAESMDEPAIRELILGTGIRKPKHSNSQK